MPLPREMPIPSATQRNKPTLQNAKMLLYRNLQPTAQPARVVTPMPITPKELAEEHWKFLEKWLHMVFVDGFIHGYKHAQQHQTFVKAIELATSEEAV